MVLLRLRLRQVAKVSFATNRATTRPAPSPTCSMMAGRVFGLHLRHPLLEKGAQILAETGHHAAIYAECLARNQARAQDSEKAYAFPDVLRRAPTPERDHALCHLCCNAAVPALIARGGGNIVNISSLAEQRMSVFGNADYTASKHAAQERSRDETLDAHACARPLTAPSTMTLLLEQPNHARCAINCRIHRSLRSGQTIAFGLPSRLFTW